MNRTPANPIRNAVSRLMRMFVDGFGYDISTVNVFKQDIDRPARSKN